MSKKVIGWQVIRKTEHNELSNDPLPEGTYSFDVFTLKKARSIQLKEMKNLPKNSRDNWVVETIYQGDIEGPRIN